MAKNHKEETETVEENIIESASTEEVEENKDIDLPAETVEKLIKNEFQMNTLGTDDIELPIVEPKENTEEETEAVEENIIDEVEYNEVDYESRGFESLEDAIDFMQTPYFESLGKADKEEYKKWLIK